MKGYVGLDVSQKKTAICVVNEIGKKLLQATVDTDPVAIQILLLLKGLGDAKVGMETGPLSVWLYHSQKNLGLNIDCIQARHVHAALSTRAKHQQGASAAQDLPPTCSGMLM